MLSMNRSMQNMTFCDWLLPMNLTFSWFHSCFNICVGISLFVWPKNTLLHGCAAFYISILRPGDICVVSTFWFLWIMLVWTLIYRFFFAYMFLFLLHLYLGVELLGHMVMLFNLSRNCQNVFQCSRTILHSR